MPVVTDEELQEQIRLCPEHVNGVLHLLLEQFKTQIETWILCKEPMEKIKFDDAMHPWENLVILYDAASFRPVVLFQRPAG